MAHPKGHSSNVAVQVTYKIPGKPDQTRTRHMPPATAALWENGGLNADKFNALTGAEQFDAINQPDTNTALQMNGDRHAINDWINETAYANKPLPADWRKCPAGSLTGIVYP